MRIPKFSRRKGSFSGEGEADEEDSQHTQLQHISGYTVIQEVPINYFTIIPIYLRVVNIPAGHVEAAKPLIVSLARVLRDFQLILISANGAPRPSAQDEDSPPYVTFTCHLRAQRNP
ncbi:unnamed protein product [Leuciscus chuanchicus]